MQLHRGTCEGSEADELGRKQNETVKYEGEQSEEQGVKKEELFVAAIRAGVTADSDIDHCCEIPSQLAIDQRERSLARQFFHRDVKVDENDEEYARNLQLLAERAFGGCPPARVTNWVAVQFCAAVQPPTIGAKLIAMKTNDLHQLVEAATRKRQELLLTSAPQTAHCRPNPPRPRWTPSRQTLRAGGAYYLLSCQLPNASRPLLKALGKLDGHPCCFLLDLGAVKSLVHPKAFPNLFRKFRARPSSMKLLSAEGRKMTAIGETLLNVTIENETYTVAFIMCPELV
ncbi:unnamed protein product [Taenia asiatica]|uniref:DUF5726 domain-containing protein n=1 Tax=Taenia asiatica TaxID=60517 RepID=A0A3P6RNK5_TAEAS|nr:unnamed protein product [Taenia asiatica]